MSGIIPIPTTRVGDLFVRQRLAGQAQRDQLDLFRLQYQISSGRRIQTPSEDAPAALRAINLQRLLSRKGQVQTNLRSSTQHLTSAEASITSVSSPLIELRAAVVGVSGTVNSDAERTEVARSIDGLLQTLLNAGNSKVGGRYLFAGSRAQAQPYDYKGGIVEYSGNEGLLRSYVDLERLFETNLAGTDVFGGISAAVEGSVDLNPQVTADTLVSTLNGGTGIGRNPAITLTVNDGLTAESRAIDLSQAVTVGDLARLIEEGAPAGSGVTADVTGTGLVLRASSGETINVSEVTESDTARLLGVLSDPDVPATNAITGLDLNPSMLKTTRLSDLLGTKATGRLKIPGSNNDIQLTAAANGIDFNGVDVVFVSGAAAGSEVATYDEGTNTLTVTISEGNSTASQVVQAITAEGAFTAAIDYRDATSTVQAGSGEIGLTGSPFVDVTTGGSGETLDTTSGLHLTNGGESVTVDISGANTVEDLLNLIHDKGIGLLAEVNANGDGINVRSRWSGADFMIGENGGTTATQLGIRTYTEETKLADLNRGLGVPTSDMVNDLEIVASNGTALQVDLTGAVSVKNVLDRINTAAVTASVAITARLAETGNGIELLDSSGGGGSLSVRAIEGSRAAEYLGFVPAGEMEVTSSTGVLQSEDRNTFETDSIFNTLIRLRTALETSDDGEIGRSLERLDADIDRLNFARAEIGGRVRNLAVIQTKLQDENVQLQAALSADIDVDLIEAVSQLTARQYAFEASLRTSASLMQMTLLNFL